MRTVSMKSLCLLCGFLVPCLGTAAPTQAGVIPWLYDSIFGYGWGGSGYGGGYGGGMPYSAGYGGGYGSGMSYSPSYSSPAYSAPMMSSPVAPTDGLYNSNYGPSLGYYDGGYSTNYGSYSSCCCAPCSTGDCATSIQSGKPDLNPTPAEEVVPVVPKTRRDPSLDSFGPTRNGKSGTGVDSVDGESAEDGAMPPIDRGPMKRPVNGGNVDPMVPPAQGDPETLGPEVILPGDSDRSIAVRYIPAPQRFKVAIPTSASRVVRIDRVVREQLVPTPSKPQLASNP